MAKAATAGSTSGCSFFFRLTGNDLVHLGDCSEQTKGTGPKQCIQMRSKLVGSLYN